MSLWRRRLAQLLRHCESGAWELPAQAPIPDELMNRLAKIKAPAWSSDGEPDRQAAEPLQTLIAEVLKTSQDEPREDLRELACGKLKTVIEPHLLTWGALHVEIGKAVEFKFLR